MCGICGIINLNKEPVSERLLRTINSTLYHWGPDDEGYFFNKVGRGVKIGQYNILTKQPSVCNINDMSVNVLQAGWL
jgi:asparagine synthetase B (glutamine-hydrolysing)